MTHPCRSFLSTTITRIVLAATVIVVGTSAAWAGPPPPGFSEDIEARFAPGTDVSPPTDALPASLAAQVASMTRLFTLSAAQLDALRSANPALPDLKLWFEIQLLEGTDPGDFLSQLQAQVNVDEAEFRPLVSPDPAVTPDFEGNQGYLGPAPDGIDAEFSWTIPGGDGTGITIYDVERAWQQTHEDLSKAAGVSQLLDAGDSNNEGNNSHGTAVIGELIGDDDTKGVTGISFGADIGLAPRITANLGNNPANAILLAAADASPGDVILIEVQTSVCDQGGCSGANQNGCGPLEWQQSAFDATQTAVANRITVVAAAGNGNVDLDMADCDDRFDRSQRDSGAIIVGAGGSAGSGNDRERLNFSSYGSRVDVQGWGDGVMTTGYGDEYTDADDPTNPDKWYTDTFGGTSSASPIVAGAVANLQGIAMQQFGVPLIPFQLRALIRDTGSPQLGDTTENIGPLPDLQSAIGQISAGAIDLFILVDTSSSFSDDLPIFQAQAPNIISSIQSMNPNVRFGLGRFDDYPISPFGDAGDVAYARLVDLTFDTAAVIGAIGGLTTNSGGDFPESQLVALFQAATGDGQDLSGQGQAQANIPAGQNANFRDGVTKLFLLWTDASFHQQGDAGVIPYPGPTFTEVVQAIEALDPPQVIGISSGGGGMADLAAIASATGALAPDGGVDCDDNGSIDVPAGDPIVCEISSTGEGIAEAIVSVVEAVVEAATPMAICMDVTTSTDPGVCAAVVSVDAGSSDPDGGPVVITQSPPGPYPVGTSAVTLKVTDDMSLSDFCVASVTVIDDELPEPSCNAPVVTPPDAPIAITATATDNCGVTSVVVSDPDCFRFTAQGKRIDKTGSCQVGLSGDTFTIIDTGGVGTHISWRVTATDENGNVDDTDCEVVIQNPGQGP
ncbi:MAG: S8 family serine peptidase [Acidobacteriota bacterium]|nr:S8 family serine peptidase [Acidobacteriota bacterium]